MHGLGRVRTIVVASCGFLLAAVLAGTGGAAAQAASTRPAPMVTGYPAQGQLNSVAVTSPDNAWAVGDQAAPSGAPIGDGDTLLLRWNGKAWSQVTSPRPVYGSLVSVAATSADNAWATGWDDIPTSHGILWHWNGKSWSVQRNLPALPGDGLGKVAASGSAVWLIANTRSSGAVSSNVLALHLIGGKWYVVPFPDAAKVTVTGVAFGSGNTAWAVGYVLSGAGIVFRWTGTIWKIAAQFGNYAPMGVAVGPGGKVWTVGTASDGADGAEGYSEYWNGKAWQSVAVPDRDGSPLFGVGYFHGGAAWAVGYFKDQDVPFMLRWTGKAWTQVATPGGRQLIGIGGDSAVNGWAVGGDGNATTILRWNGKTWN